MSAYGSSGTLLSNLLKSTWSGHAAPIGSEVLAAEDNYSKLRQLGEIMLWHLPLTC